MKLGLKEKNEQIEPTDSLENQELAKKPKLVLPCTPSIVKLGHDSTQVNI